MLANDGLSIVFFICFRETLETSIVVSILLAFIKQHLGPDKDVMVYKKLRKQVSYTLPTAESTLFQSLTRMADLARNGYWSRDLYRGRLRYHRCLLWPRVGSLVQH